MFNSFSDSYSSSNSESYSYSNAQANNHNEINNFSPITRNSDLSKFKKIKINSLTFDLITSSNPRILEKIKIETDFNKSEEIYNSFIECTYFYQKVKVLTFNQISSEEMLIEYEPINDLKKNNIFIRKEVNYSDFSHRELTYIMPTYQNITKQIINELLQNDN